MNKDSPIFIAGQDTIIGKSLMRFLKKKQYTHVTNFDYDSPNLNDSLMVEKYFLKTKPKYVFMLGGLSGGIKMNQDHPSSLMMDNLKSIVNIFSCSFEHQVKKIIFLASSCVYPKYSKQPMNPEDLMSGTLEPTNSSYAISKLAGIELCSAYRKEFGSNFISAIPTNIFGPNDNFVKGQSHVIPALIKKIHEAKQNKINDVLIWGTGTPLREFIYVEDLARACVFLMVKYSNEKPINIGTNYVYSIGQIAIKVKELIGFKGDLVFDNSKPNGMPKKILNSKKIFSLGWKPKTSIDEGLGNTYNWFLSNNLTV